MTDQYADLAEVAARAAQAGGVAALAHFRCPETTVQDKGGHAVNLLTSGDLASQKAVLDIITAVRPHDGVVAEEEDLSIPAQNEVTWYVDPIDSTANFAHGLPGWSVSVGAKAEDRPVAGAVFDPSSGELISGAEGHGVKSNRPRTPTVDPQNLQEAVAFVSVQSYHPDCVRIAGTWMTVPGKSRAPGSPALGLALTALGRYDIFLACGHYNEWDLTAGLALCRAAQLTVICEQSHGCHVIAAFPQSLAVETTELLRSLDLLPADSA